MSFWHLFSIGAMMGIADLIPGVSGGTVAFISGIYQDLIDSLHNLNFRFLLPLAAGIGGAFLTLAHFLGFLLNHPTYRSFLFAFFFGVVLSSTFSCLKRARPKRVSHWTMVIMGGSLAFLVIQQVPSIDSESHSFLWLFVCGGVTTMAMLLPGVSGSYLLNLLGVYTVALNALTHPLHHLPQLIALVLGGLIGIALFSWIIKRLLMNYLNLSLCFLIGFMFGGLPSLWPWSGEFYRFSIGFLFLGLLFPIFLEVRAKGEREYKFKENI